MSSLPTRTLLAVAMMVAACSATGDDRPREELEGVHDDTTSGPSAGAGGSVLPGVGGAGGVTTTTSTTVGVTVGVGGLGGAGSCSSLDEPNDSEATALGIGAINDCDDNGAMLAGALDGPTDEDWYFYSGSDDFGCVVDPTRSVTATGPLRLCKFADCDGVSVTCQNGSQSASSPKGNPGCCHTQGFGMDVDCSGMNDDATIHLRFDQAGAVCVEYSLDYHY